MKNILDVDEFRASMFAMLALLESVDRVEPNMRTKYGEQNMINSLHDLKCKQNVRQLATMKIHQNKKLRFVWIHA